jgi:hypothetical protein
MTTLQLLGREHDASAIVIDQAGLDAANQSLKERQERLSGGVKTSTGMARTR